MVSGYKKPRTVAGSGRLFGMKNYAVFSALTRLPAHTIVNGLRAEDVGDPDYEQMLRDHVHYVARLQKAGACVIELPALEDYPDSVFVEDDTLNCTGKTEDAIV